MFPTIPFAAGLGVLVGVLSTRQPLVAAALVGLYYMLVAAKFTVTRPIPLIAVAMVVMTILGGQVANLYVYHVLIGILLAADLLRGSPSRGTDAVSWSVLFLVGTTVLSAIVGQAYFGEGRPEDYTNGIASMLAMLWTLAFLVLMERAVSGEEDVHILMAGINVAAWVNTVVFGGAAVFILGQSISSVIVNEFGRTRGLFGPVYFSLGFAWDTLVIGVAMLGSGFRHRRLVWPGIIASMVLITWQSMVYFTRGPLIGGVVALGYILLKQRTSARLTWTYVIVGVTLIFLTFANAPGDEGLPAKAAKRFEDLIINTTERNPFDASTSEGNRLLRYAEGLRLFEQSPIVGIGPGFYYLRSRLYVFGERAGGPHSAWVGILAERGIIGVLATLIFYAVMMRVGAALITRGTSPFVRRLGALNNALIVSKAFLMLFQDELWPIGGTSTYTGLGSSFPVWVVFACAIALNRQLLSQERGDQRESTNHFSLVSEQHQPGSR